MKTNSLLLEAEKLRRKLEKLETKKKERLAEVAAEYDGKILNAKIEAGDDVLVLLESANNLGPALAAKAAE